MQDSVQTVVNFILGLIGLIATIGVFPSIVTGIVLLATNSRVKNPKQKKRRKLFGIALICLCPALVLFTLLVFAIVNTIMTSTTGV